MSLTALNHKKLALVSVAVTSASTLNGIYTAATAATYANGASRTPGVGSAVKNVARYQNGGVTEAVYGEYAGADMAGVKWIFVAQDVAVAAPKMLNPDGFSSTVLNCGIVRNAGAYLAWDNVNPFTTGDFAGYSQCGVSGASATTGVEVYESQDTIWVSTFGVPDTTVWAAGIGALWDPDTADGSAAELNGRRIGVLSAGSNSIDGSATFGFLQGQPAPATSPTAASFLDWDNIAGQPKAYALAIGLNTVNTLIRDSYMRAANTSTPTGWVSSGALADGRIVKRGLGVHVVGLAGGAVLSMTVCGQLRNISCHPSARSGSVLQEGATDVAYAIGQRHLTSGNVILLNA